MIEKETLPVLEQRRARAPQAKEVVRLVESRRPRSQHCARRSPHPPRYSSPPLSSLPCLRQMDPQVDAVPASLLHRRFSQPSRFLANYSVDRTLQGVKARGRQTMWRSPRPKTETQAARSLLPNLVVSNSLQSCYLRVFEIRCFFT